MQSGTPARPTSGSRSTVSSLKSRTATTPAATASRPASSSATTVPGRTPAPTGIACQTAPGSGRTAAMAMSTRVSRNATTATISAVRAAATPTARRARPAGMEFGSPSSAKAAMQVRTMESPAPDAARPARSSSSSAGAPTGWAAGSRSDLGHLLRVAKTLFGFVPLGLGRVT